MAVILRLPAMKEVYHEFQDPYNREKQKDSINRYIKAA